MDEPPKGNAAPPTLPPTGKYDFAKHHDYVVGEFNKKLKERVISEELSDENVEKQAISINAQGADPQYYKEMVKRDIQYREMKRLLDIQLENCDNRWDWDDLAKIEEIERLMESAGLDSDESPKLQKDKEAAEEKRKKAQKMSRDIHRGDEFETVDGRKVNVKAIIDKSKENGKLSAEDAGTLASLKDRDSVRDAIRISKQAGMVDEKLGSQMMQALGKAL